MTLVRFNKPVAKSFNNLMDDFFPVMPSLFGNDFPNGNLKSDVPVNIRESEQSYILDVFAPGWNKEDLKVEVNDNLLTISAEKVENKEETSEKLLRSEYGLKSFKRSFTIDERMDGENISAGYVNGVLTLNLPKKEEVKPAVKQITIQ